MWGWVGAVLWLVAAGVAAQEFPGPLPGERFDCTTGCRASRHRAVTCWAWATTTDPPRCQSYCQGEGQPPRTPGPGWTTCAASAPAGLACNATEYVFPDRPPVCDGGTADGLVP